jgi:hypothetical protein
MQKNYRYIALQENRQYFSKVFKIADKSGHIIGPRTCR